MSLRDWLTLTMTPGLGPIRLRRLLDAAGSPAEAVRAPSSLLMRIEGFGPKLAADVAAGLKSVVPDVDAELRKAESLGVALLCPDDEQYPPLLRLIPDPPGVLWVWGELEARDLNAVGIVGSRRPSTYGKEQAERFAGLLAGGGYTVVSGGAYGVDSAAHRGALRATDGRTIAVLGCGVDVPYPPENRELFAAIADGRGAIVSEHPLGAPPRKENFPRRNRIISGASRGVLVVEADLQSGALITARQAADDHGRPVFALPGRVDNPMSAGPHELIRQGAILKSELDDILGNLGPLPADAYEPDAGAASTPLFDGPGPMVGPAVALAVEPAGLDEADRQILAALAAGPLGVDALIDATGLPASRAQAALMMLGIRGHVRRGSDGRFEQRR